MVELDFLDLGRADEGHRVVAGLGHQSSLRAMLIVSSGAGSGSVLT
jgi:hypothetical protein